MVPDVAAASDFCGAVLPHLATAFAAPDGPCRLVATRPHRPPAWVPYLQVRTVEEIPARARRFGATILPDPVTWDGAATSVLLEGPSGACLGLIQDPPERTSPHDAPPWYDAVVDHPDRTVAFLGSVLGWTSRRRRFAGSSYDVLHEADRPMAGCRPLRPGMRPRWEVWFDVPDCDAAAADARRHGARLIFRHDDPAFGGTAVLVDPQGVSFCLITHLSSTDDEPKHDQRR